MFSRFALTGAALAIGAGIILYFMNQTGDLLKRVQGDVEAVTGVEFTPDGAWIFSSGSRGLKRWNAETLMLDKDWRSIPAVFGELKIISRMTISPTEPHLFLCAGRFVVVWDYKAEKEIATFEGEQKAAITAIAVNKQGTVLACGEWGVEYDEYGNAHGAPNNFWIHLWNLKSRESIVRFQSPTKCIVSGLDFSPDGAFLASRAGRETVVWNGSTGNEIVRIGGSKAVIAVSDHATRPIAFSPDGKWLFNEDEFLRVGTWESTLKLTQDIFGPVPVIPKGETWSMVCLASDVTPDSSRLLASFGNSIALIDVETGKLDDKFVQFKKGSGVLSVAISPDGRMAVSGGDGIVAQGGFGYSSDESNRNLCFWRMPKEEEPRK